MKDEVFTEKSTLFVDAWHDISDKALPFVTPTLLVYCATPAPVIG